ncbi:hypothetical protein SASPL_122459 [Salvia splendens]|uniref:Uncharacterized protein n=1 Tax=Salvia splendens TaxID=180675 RepID=A0A8X8XLM7_SALSN|nr:uncharacterized protein LOC121743796 [Salvia splendens]KAG6415057.1 hypothetical protein SASPL_122459 [Salvia splendens]
MGSFSGLGIGLSFVFGCILMGLVAELYYLLWWKKKLTTTTTTATTKEMQEFSLLFCWRKPKSFGNSNSSSQELTNPANNHQETQDLEIGGNKELALKCEEGIEAELMRVHNLCGPPRFLFTIKEESKEDLELSEDGRSRKGSRTRSLSDLFVDAAPLECYSHHGIINPLFESLPEAELRRLRSSPPPKFKFLRDAEDKLLRRLAQEEAERRIIDQNLQQDSILEDGSFLKFLNVRDKIHNQAKQVLPLPSSPTN